MVANDFNTESQPSDETIGAVCQSPGHIEKPNYTSSTASSITINWTQPFHDGGCPILTYSIYLSTDGGVTYTEVDPANVQNKPYLSEYEVTGLTLLDQEHYFKIEAFNELGSSISVPSIFILAAKPNAPTNGPV